MTRPVLVPVRVLEGESVPSALIETLAPVPIVLLGYHVVPEQTAPGQARLQFEERARTELDDLRDSVDAAGGSVETRLVFTHDATTTIERVAVEEDAGSILLSNPAPAVDRVLVALSAAINLDRIAGVVSLLVADTGLPVTLYHATASAADRDAAADLLSDFGSRLVDRGVDAAAITTRVDVTETPERDVIAVASEFDLVVVGESEPELLDRVFGDFPQRLADESLTPTLVVRRLVEAGPRAGADDDTDESGDGADGE
ncbi:MAG: universal stress protein [Haloplanus sp.]